MEKRADIKNKQTNEKTPPEDEEHLLYVFQPLSQNEVHSLGKLKKSPHFFKDFSFTCGNVGA